MASDELELLAKRYVAARPHYSLIGLKGGGASAQVFELETPLGTRALKIYQARFFEGPDAEAEKKRVELQRRLMGSGCPQLVDIFAISPLDNTFCVEMEFLPWNELRAHLGQIPVANADSILAQLALAVRFLEKNGLVHRDIKPANILIDSELKRIKLVDFGVIRELSPDGNTHDLTDHGPRKPFIATAQYSSPEYLFRLEEPSENLWRGLTLYQLGGVLHDLITGRQLFEDAVLTGNRYRVAWAVLTQFPSFDGALGKVPSRLITLAANCLTKRLSTRLALVTIDDFLTPPSDKILTLQRQLSDIGIRRAVRQNENENAERSALQRRTRVQSLSSMLATKFFNTFGSTIKIENSNDARSENRFVLYLTLPDHFPKVSLTVTLSWSTSLGEETAEVLLHVQAQPTETQGYAQEKIVGILPLIGSIDEPIVEDLFREASGHVSQIVDLTRNGSDITSTSS